MKKVADVTQNVIKGFFEIISKCCKKSFLILVLFQKRGQKVFIFNLFLLNVIKLELKFIWPYFFISNGFFIQFFALSLSIYLSISISLSLSLSIFLSFSLRLSLSLSLSIFLCGIIWLSLSFSHSISVSMYVCLFQCRSLLYCLFLFLSLTFCIF